MHPHGKALILIGLATLMLVGIVKAIRKGQGWNFWDWVVILAGISWSAVAHSLAREL